MMSLGVARPQLATQRRAEDWESWKSLIRDKFLVDNMEVNAIVAELHYHGFEITKPQLENRLKLWGIRKKLKPEIWRSVKSLIATRAAAFKQSVVILSGLRLPVEKVDYEIRRNELVTLGSTPNPKAVPGHIPLYICTPRSSSADVTLGPTLPEDLPWLQFSRAHLPAVLGWMRFAVLPNRTVPIPITGPVPDFSLSQFARQGPMVPSKSAQSALFPAAFQQIVRRSLVTLIGSEEMTVQLFARNSIDCLAARFDLALPETYRDENVYRASILAAGRFSEVQAEAFKLILYLVSNRLIMGLPVFTHCSVGSSYLDDAQTLISLCRLSGLAERQMIDNTVRLSRTSPTLAAVVDVIFEAAVNTDAADIVAHLLDVDERIHPERKIGLVRYEACKIGRKRYEDILGPAYHSERWSPLVLAAVHGSVDLVKVLLDRGADIRQNAPHGLSLAATAALQPSRLLSRNTVKLLVERGADINEDQTSPRSALSPLHAAILMGDTDLVNFLVAAGADMNYRYRIEEYETSLHSFIWHPFDGVVFNMYDIGCLGIATLFGAYICQVNPQFVNRQERQKNVLDLCQWIFENFGSWMELFGYETEDAMILAAAQGYSDVVSFLYSQVSSSVDAASGYFSPMIAAVTFGNHDTCRLLLELGASSSQHEIDRELLEAKPYRSALASWRMKGLGPRLVPHLLHIAVASNCCNTVKLLIEHGADVDEACAVKLYCGRQFYWPPEEINRGPTERMRLSPLKLAIILEYWDVAVVLVNLGATPMASDLVAAAKGGSLKLVSQLVRMGIHPNNAIVDGTGALQAALVHGHGEIAEILFGSASPALDVSLIRRLHQQQWPETQTDDGGRSSVLECAILSGWSKAIKQTFSLYTTAYDSGALCAAVYMAVIQHRLPDEDYVLGELLHRRDRDAGRSHQDLVLENTAISLAAWHQRLDIVARLLAHQPFPPAQHFAIDPFYSTNPWWKHNCGGCLRPECRLEFCRPEDVFWDAEKWHRLPTEHASTLLFAVQGQNVEIITALLDAGYKADGFTLRLAISTQLPLSLIRRLTEHCTDVDAFCAMDDDSAGTDNYTPLHIAASQGQTEIIRVLLSHGANLNEIRPERQFEFGTYSALTRAIELEQWPAVSFLLDRGTNVNEPVWSPNQPFVTSPLQLAAMAGYIGIVRRLLGYGADVNAQRSIYCGFTALEGAAVAGRLDTVSLLLASDVHTEGYGRVQFVRAIFEASKREHGAVVAILRSHRPWTVEDQSIWDELEHRASGSFCFLHPAEHSPGQLVNVIATVQDDKPYCLKPRWTMPFCPQGWNKSAATEVLKYANVVIAEHPEITASDAEDDAARVAEKAFLEWSGIQLKPGFWLGHVFDRLENPERALDAVSRALQGWASSMRSAEETAESGTLGGVVQLSWSDFEDNSEHPTSGAEYLAMEVCDETNTCEDGVERHDGNQEEAGESSEHERCWEEARQRAFRRDMLGEEAAPFFPMDFQV